MAESEGAPKLSEFYVGIVDLFGTVLPGAIITFTVLASSPLGEKLETAQGAKFWAVFLAVSYVTGHVISALGGLLLDEIYDTAYKIYEENESYFAMRIRAKHALKKQLTPYFRDDDNAMSWSDVTVRMDSPAAAAEVDRLEADSKFFRSLAVVVILAWPMYVVLAAPRFGCDWCSWLLKFTASCLPLIAVLSVKVFVYNKIEEKDERDKSNKRAKMHEDVAKKKAGTLPAPQKNQPELDDVELYEKVEQAKQEAKELNDPCRRAVRWGICFWMGGFLLSGFQLKWPTGLASAGLGFLGLFSIWRYMERRLKRTTLTYTYVVALFSKRELAGEKPKQPEEVARP